MSRDYADDDVIFDTQWRALKNAMNGNGVLDPAPALTPGGAMAVSIGAANVMRNKVLTAIVPGNVTFTVVSAKSKWGAIWVPATGIPYMKMGAEADRPIMPEPNSWDDVLLGGVLITLGMTVITAPDIIEMMFMTTLQKHASRHQLGGTDEISLTGMTGLLATAQTPVVHGHAQHTDRTRKIWIPAGAFALGGTATFALSVPGTGDIAGGIGIGTSGQSFTVSIPIPADIKTGTTNINIVFHYAYDDTIGTTPAVDIHVLKITGDTTPLTPSWDLSLNNKVLPHDAAPGNYRRYPYNIGNLDWSVYDTVIVHVVGASTMYAYIIGLEFEYTADM